MCFNYIAVGWVCFHLRRWRRSASVHDRRHRLVKKKSAASESHLACVIAQPPWTGAAALAVTNALHLPLHPVEGSVVSSWREAAGAMAVINLAINSWCPTSERFPSDPSHLRWSVLTYGQWWNSDVHSPKYFIYGQLFDTSPVFKCSAPSFLWSRCILMTVEETKCRQTFTFLGFTALASLCRAENKPLKAASVSQANKNMRHR